jgi:hypothetical protein
MGALIESDQQHEFMIDWVWQPKKYLGYIIVYFESRYPNYLNLSLLVFHT